MIMKKIASYDNLALNKFTKWQLFSLKTTTFFECENRRPWMSGEGDPYPPLPIMKNQLTLSQLVVADYAHHITKGGLISSSFSLWLIQK